MFYASIKIFLHGAQVAVKDACHNLSEMEFVGEAVMAKTCKPKASKSNRRTSDVGCPVTFRRGGVIMPHVVSPEATGGRSNSCWRDAAS